MTAPRCPCCPDGIMQERSLSFMDGGREDYLVCSWCGHCENDPDRSKRRATTLAASQRQFHVGD